MSKSMLKIYTRVFKKKMEDGATFDEVAEQYPRLTEGELEAIKTELDK